MSFTSFPFLLLVLGTLVLYYTVPGKAQWFVLLAASYVFYLWASPILGLYPIAITLITYLAALRLSALNARKGSMDKARLKRHKRAMCALTLLSCFGLLFALKYLDGVLVTVGALTGQKFTPLSLVVPMGISYYIFQSCGYVIDAYRGKYPVERNFGKYALFVAFFPQMVQGPISRYRDLGPQLSAARRPDAVFLRDGIQLVLWGLFKKLVIADRAAAVVGTVIDDYSAYSGGIILFAVIFYCIQLYGDFSGGIDIARGVAELFGIEMPENFRRPLFATSIADFWRRWHITLGGWMRDYVFYPLSFSRPFSALGRFARKHLHGAAGKILPTSAVTFIVYFFIGIWHGSDPKYIFFGLWNGVLITAALLLEPVFARIAKAVHLDRECALFRAFRMVRTALIVLIGRYITRAETFLGALDMLSRTVNTFALEPFADGTLLKLGLTAQDYIVLGVSLLCLLIVEGIQERGVKIRRSLGGKNGFVQWLAMFALTAVVLIYGFWIKGEIATGFIYMQY